MKESRNFKNLTNLDARELNELGNAYADYGMWDKALECYERSLSLRREAKDRRGEMVVLNNLGALYHRQGLWEEALGHYRRSRHLARELGEGSSELATLMNMAFIQFTRGRREEFFLLAEEAEGLAKKLEGWGSLSKLSWLRGRLAFADAAIEVAMAHYREALHYAAREGAGALEEILRHVDEEVDRLLAQDSPGLALVFCDYLLVACQGIEGVRDHLAGKREELLSPSRLPGGEGSGKEN